MLDKFNHVRTAIREGREDRFNIAHIVDSKPITFKDRLIFLNRSNKLNGYMNKIKQECHLIDLTDEEFKKYKYKPKLMSYELYDTPELWFLLLRINSMLDPSEFTRKRIYILKPEAVDLINRIYVIESEEDYGYI